THTLTLTLPPMKETPSHRPTKSQRKIKSRSKSKSKNSAARRSRKFPTARGSRKMSCSYSYAYSYSPSDEGDAPILRPRKTCRLRTQHRIRRLVDRPSGGHPHKTICLRSPRPCIHFHPAEHCGGQREIHPA